ncbi:MAG: arsenate reductase (glutaredoxin) [Gammaproteobacteria bacterium]|nr:arsenate reductase (glutaredoxin) [Gammaproteobacteria bacterium]
MIIYHNPRCSKSRQTLALIEENGVTPEVVEYLKTPLSAAELKDIVTKLGVTVRDIIRNKETEFKDNGLNDTSLSDDAIYRVLANTPKLVERPIVVKGEKAVIGRPPENVLELLK